MKGTVLAIDAGNTRLKWGLHDGVAWMRQGWLETERARFFSSALGSIPELGAVVISNVAGDRLHDELAGVLPAMPGPRWIRSMDEQCGVRNGYADPSQLGCDRWAALLGARAAYGGALLVVCAGTATTVDALTAEGDFLGGIIMPGVATMKQALADHTAHLKLQPGAFCRFPDNTGDAILSGAIDAACGAIERIRHYLAEARGAEPRVVLSGGGARSIAPHLNVTCEVVDNLVLEGLIAIARASV